MTRGTTLATGVERGGVLGAGVIDVGALPAGVGSGDGEADGGGAANPVQEVLRSILANAGFLVRFNEGPSYGGRSRMQEKSVFSCTVVSEKAGCGSKHVDPHILLAYHVLQTDYTPGIRVLPTCRSHVRMNVDGYYEEGLARICDPRGKFRLRSLLW